MGIEQVIEAVCRPVDWWQLHLSYLELQKASGYADPAERVGEGELAAHLRANPDLIQKRLELSDGKRVSEGWYFLPPDASFDGQH